MNIPNPAQAHASISIAASSSSLEALGYVLNPATDSLLIQCVGGDVRMTLNGTNPTSSFGFKIADCASVGLGLVEIGVAKFIIGTGSPKLEIIAYIK